MGGGGERGGGGANKTFWRFGEQGAEENILKIGGWGERSFFRAQEA